MISGPVVKYVLTAALRDRLLIVLLLMILVGGALGAFLGSSAVIEGDRFALVFSAAGLRFASMIGLVLFVVFYVRRAFEAREVEFLLSRPLNRTSFIFSHAAALSLLALLVAAIVTAAIFMVAPRHASGGVALWGGSLAAELVIMANAAFFFAMILPSATAGAMASLGLYILARLMGEILGIVYSGAFSERFTLLVWPMKAISLIVPRLDLLVQSSWLVYGPDSSVTPCFIAAQGLAYAALLVVAALIDLARRQF